MVVLGSSLVQFSGSSIERKEGERVRMMALKLGPVL